MRGLVWVSSKKTVSATNHKKHDTPLEQWDNRALLLYNIIGECGTGIVSGVG